MMPQGLNEAIVAIRFIQTIEILRPELEQEWLENVHRKLFREMFRLLAPQAVEIHNISCWSLAAIGVMGLAMKDQEMIDYAFTSPFNIRRQLAEGVTADGFWYEGSIHYNFFLLEGVSYLFLFSKIYGYDFGQESTAIFERMFEKAYEYAFDNLYLPNPNDGWPNLNLRTFSYVYHTAARAFGEKSKVGNLLKSLRTTPILAPLCPFRSLITAAGQCVWNSCCSTSILITAITGRWPMSPIHSPPPTLPCCATTTGMCL